MKISYILFKMNKRKHNSESLDKKESTETKHKIIKHWSLGLLESMKNPENIKKESKNALVIMDKFPKAKVHYLILPRDDIKSIYNLNNDHIELVKEFIELYESLKVEHKSLELKGGFHAVPSMQRLHMHVISTDFVSSCLKTKQHWNSFTTKFFIPCDDLLKILIEDKCIKKISSEEHKNLIASNLQCHKCSYKPKNMPQLKEHLLTH